MFLIGLTGGIASGKSTVSSIFATEFGVPVIDADVIARKVVEPNTKGWRRVKKIFGSEVINADQTINREKLGEIVFTDSAKRRDLNKSLHGLIAVEIFKQVLINFIKGYRFVILDVPLLFEAKQFLNLLSFKVVVYCDDETEQIRRLIKRNPTLSESDAKLRIESQLGTKEKLKLADYCVDNSGSLDNTRKQIKNLYEIFAKSKKHVWIRLFLASIFFGVAFSVFKMVSFLK